MDIKVEIKEESDFLDFCSQRELITKDPLKNVKGETIASDNTYDTDSKVKIEEGAVVSKFLSQKEREMVPEHPVIKFNKSNKESETEAKIEIKEEQRWFERASKAIPSIYTDIKDGIDEGFFFIKSPSLYKVGVSRYTSDLLSNEDLGNDISCDIRKDSPKCESAGKCKSEERYGRDISSVETSLCSETPDGGKTASMAPCLKHNNLLQQSNTNKVINEGNCKPIRNREYRRVYKCDICEKCFKYSSHLKTHRFVHESKEANKCDICEKGFNHLSSLKRHKLFHDGIKPHKCSICDKTFTHLQDLKRHKLIHEGIKPHMCNICNRSFTQMSNLKAHRLIHEGIKPHKCNICNKAFTQSSSLKTHKFIHEAIKPHRCSICDKTFTHLQQLEAHKLIHEGIKPHKCSICDKTFTHLSSLKRHNLIHEGIKPHECKVCDKTFAHLQYLKRHIVIHEFNKPQ